MIKEKKVYPSQINSKAIACRIPADDYVKFLQDAISKNITLNDWLMMRIYSNSNNQVESEIESAFGFSSSVVSNSIIESDEKFMKGCYENFHIRTDETTGFPFIQYQIQSDYWKNRLARESIRVDNFKDLKYVIGLDAIQENKKEITISDIKAQLIILAQNSFKNSKDVRGFMKDINSCLSELEDLE